MLTVLRRRASPVALLERQSGQAVLAADHLHALVHDVTQARGRARAVTALAHDGHERLADLMRRRRAPWRMPFDRGELHALARGVDAVLGALREAAEGLTAEGREPTAASRALTDVIPKSVAAMDQAIHALRHGGAALHDHLVEVNRLENLADALLLEAVAALVREEPDRFAVLRWTEIYERLEAVTNHCQTVAANIERIDARQI